MNAEFIEVWIDENPILINVAHIVNVSKKDDKAVLTLTNMPNLPVDHSYAEVITAIKKSQFEIIKLKLKEGLVTFK